MRIGTKMGTYVLNDKDVSSIHNGVCSLYRALDNAKEMLKDDSSIVVAIKSALKSIQPVKDRISKEQDVLFNKQMDYFNDVRSENDFSSIWSIYTYDDFSFNDKHNLPIGAQIVCYDVPIADDRFKITGDTWLDVWNVVDSYLSHYSNAVGNHLFIEGFKATEKNGETVVHVTLGS